MAKKNGQLPGRRGADKQRGTASGSQAGWGPVAPTSAAAAQPSREDVARRAYEISRSRGGVHGRDVEDWLAAERELRHRFIN